MEPTIIEEQSDSLQNIALKPYVEATQALAKKYHLLLIPTHQRFQDYLQSSATQPLTTDGVHIMQPEMC